MRILVAVLLCVSVLFSVCGVDAVHKLRRIQHTLLARDAAFLGLTPLTILSKDAPASMLLAKNCGDLSKPFTDTKQNFGVLKAVANAKYKVCPKVNGALSDQCTDPADGLYSFITTIHGDVVIKNARDAGNGVHAEIQEGVTGNGVNKIVVIGFAGEVVFSGGAVSSWNNKSGAFRPKEKYCTQAGLPVAKYVRPNDQAKPEQVADQCPGAL